MASNEMGRRSWMVRIWYHRRNFLWFPSVVRIVPNYDVRLEGGVLSRLEAGLHVAQSQHAAAKTEGSAGEIGPRGKSQNMNTWATDRAPTQGFKRGRETEKNICTSEDRTRNGNMARLFAAAKSLGILCHLRMTRTAFWKQIRVSYIIIMYTWSITMLSSYSKGFSQAISLPVG
jgi:hypothetical protein